MRLFLVKAVALLSFSNLCALAQPRPAHTQTGSLESRETALQGPACKHETFNDDVTEYEYRVCPGVGGYQLQVRPVESGRLSIFVISPSKQTLPLRFEEVVTRSTDSVDASAKWRVRIENGKEIPVGLIVGTTVYDWKDPEKVEGKYWVVASIAPTKACVTDRIRQVSGSEAEAQRAADSAAGRSCARRLPLHKN